MTARAEAIVAAVSSMHPSAVAAPTEALPGRRLRARRHDPVRTASRSTATILAALRRHDRPVIARSRDDRTLLDLRTVDPADDAIVVAALAAPRPVAVPVVATAGHVDHGKSSLVLALTGTDPDRFEEEKRRGLTIDLGFAHTTLPSGAELSFVDVPGHVRFLRNMLAGVGGVDACLFVVAATEGWKPQTEEHLRILELLGVAPRRRRAHQGPTSSTTTRSSSPRIDVADHVAGTFLADAPVVAVSATTGAGLDELRAALDVLVARTTPGDATAADPGCGSTGCSRPRAAAPSSPAR